MSSNLRRRRLSRDSASLSIFEKAGLPPGVLNLVHVYGDEAGWPLVTHPLVDVVLFTGSAQVGSMIKERCA